MLLPSCPLRLKTSFVWRHQLGGAVLVLIGVSAAIGYAWWQYDAVADLLDQTRIWQTGVPGSRTEVDGKVTTNKFIFHTYDLTVKFLDANQAKHESKLEFDTLGFEVDQAKTPHVHYRPDDPARFALSWAVDAKAGRWLSFLFMGIVGVGLVGGSFTYLGVMSLRRLADARRCARRADEVLVRVTKLTQQIIKGRHTGNEFTYAGQTMDGRPVTGKAIFPVKQEPLFADAGRQTMVALVAQENLKRPVVLRGDFYPFDLTPEEQARVRAEIARRVPAAG